MPIPFKIVKRKSPKDESQKFYAAKATTPYVGREAFVKEIADYSTLTVPDAVAVLSALQQHVVSHLLQGRTVKLGDVGSFRLAVHSKKADKEEDLKLSLLTSCKVVFVPSSAMKEQLSVKLKNVKFRLVV